MMRSTPAGSEAICAWRAIVRRWRVRALREELDVGQQVGELSLRSHAHPPGVHPRQANVRCAAPLFHEYEGEVERKRGAVRRLAIFVVRRRWWVLGLALIALPVSALLRRRRARQALSRRLRRSRRRNRAKAAAAIAKEFPSSAQSDFVIVVTAKRRDRRQPGSTRGRNRPHETLAQAQPGVVAAFSYWSTRQRCRRCGAAIARRGPRLRVVAGNRRRQDRPWPASWRPSSKPTARS